MEPQIQYARTDDGVSIAYTTTGDGPPVLYCPSHSISMQSRRSDTTSVGRELAAPTSFTTFDHPGIGASQRDVSDFSLDAQVRAIEAVAARIADDRFTLVATTTGTAGAALYAARHPDRVRALACLFPAPPLFTELYAAAMREDWSLARRRWASMAFPDGPVSSQRWYSTAIRESMTAEVAAAYIEEFARADLREIYRRIPVPTLLCIGQAEQSGGAALALASLVPDCRVAVISAGVAAEPAAAILEFMGVAAAQPNTALHGESSTPALAGAARGTAIILFTDIVDSTGLTERMGDAAFRAPSRALDERVRAAIRECGGTPVAGKVLGDGVMGVFTSAAEAIDAARRCVELSAESELRLHIGLHAGDVIREADNVYGGAVNTASRICGLSTPGEVLVSQTIRDLARTSADVTFEDRGEHALKGIEDPVRVFAVRWRP
jgi:class 3 adenylate cyclase